MIAGIDRDIDVAHVAQCFVWWCSCDVEKSRSVEPRCDRIVQKKDLWFFLKKEVALS